MPLLQTMVHLLPWVRQWHDDDGETASSFEAYVAAEARKVEVSLEEAHVYRRPKKVAAAKKTATVKKTGVNAKDGSAPQELDGRPKSAKPEKRK